MQNWLYLIDLRPEKELRITLILSDTMSGL